MPQAPPPAHRNPSPTSDKRTAALPPTALRSRNQTDAKRSFASGRSRCRPPRGTGRKGGAPLDGAAETVLRVGRKHEEEHGQRSRQGDDQAHVRALVFTLVTIETARQRSVSA